MWLLHSRGRRCKSSSTHSGVWSSGIRRSVDIGEANGSNPFTLTIFMNTKDVGEASEARVIYEFKKRGTPVLQPVGDNQPYDIVIDSPDGLLKLQVKSGWVSDGVVKFNTSRISQRTSNSRTDYTEDEIDAFVIFCEELDECYWVDVSDASDGKMSIRFEDANFDHPNINWHTDYILDSKDF